MTYSFKIGESTDWSEGGKGDAYFLYKEGDGYICIFEDGDIYKLNETYGLYDLYKNIGYDFEAEELTVKQWKEIKRTAESLLGE